MKKILIVSPHFPPVNAADMHRVRQSLPFFERFGWEPTVLTVDPKYVEMAEDELLECSIPKSIKIHKVAALSTTYTRKLGLGNLGLRAFPYLLKKGNELLKTGNFDLVYFSTTVFACMPLGPIWKKKFSIPFIIDMQDPWRNDYHLNLPKQERPPKFWFAYRLDKTLEAFTLPKVDGLISVSPNYIKAIKNRYSGIKWIPSKVLTFGAHALDFEVSSKINDEDMAYQLDANKVNIVYAGAVPKNMLFAIESIFKALKKGVKDNALFKSVQMHFLGTNYAVGEQVKSLITPLISKYELEDIIVEHEERLPYFEVLKLVKTSDLAVIPGTLDGDYTASKLFPYIMAKKPLVAVFHENSTIIPIMKKLNYGIGISFNEETELKSLATKVSDGLSTILQKGQTNEDFNIEEFRKYQSEYLCQQQVHLFNEVLLKHKMNSES